MSLFKLKEFYLLGKLALACSVLSAVDIGWVNTFPTLSADFHFQLVGWI